MIDYRIIGYSSRTEGLVHKAVKRVLKLMPKWFKRHKKNVFYFVAPTQTNVIQNIQEEEMNQLNEGVRFVTITRRTPPTIVLYMVSDYMKMVVSECPALRAMANAHIEFIAGGEDIDRPITEDSLFFHLAWYVQNKQTLKGYNEERCLLCENLMACFDRVSCTCQ